MDDNRYWEAVQARDAAFDGEFVYAVKTTGIYCRPTCPSRRPHRKNVTFFATPAEAEAAGFRACQRCHPNHDARVEPHTDLIIDICRYLEEDHEQRPTLEDLGQRFGMSPFHLQRTFKRVVGVTPRQYADVHRNDRLRSQLKEADTVLDAGYAAGYGTSSSLYDHGTASLGMTPVHYRKGGEALTIRYTLAKCDLGWLLVAATERGVCKISLGDNDTALRGELEAEFPNAGITQDDTPLRDWVTVLVDYIDGQRAVLDLPLDIRATGFQRKVWEALRAIPYGSTRSYQEIAASIGQPTASRAVAQACASNPVAMVIPCHRVVRGDGSLSGYRWGIGRKRALLSHERDITGSGE